MSANPGGKDVDDPQWKDDPGMQDWLAWMKKYYPEGDVHDGSNGYAYSAAQTLVYVLRRAGDDLTRANILRQATSIKDLELPLALPGIKVNTSPTDYRPFDQFFLFRFDGERWVRFGDVYDAGTAHQ